jgi:hypothetical protein
MCVSLSDLPEWTRELPGHSRRVMNAFEVRLILPLLKNPLYEAYFIQLSVLKAA